VIDVDFKSLKLIPTLDVRQSKNTCVSTNPADHHFYYNRTAKYVMIIINLGFLYPFAYKAKTARHIRIYDMVHRKVYPYGIYRHFQQNFSYIIRVVVKCKYLI
jgi:hypothetical protein